MKSNDPIFNNFSTTETRTDRETASSIYFSGSRKTLNNFVARDRHDSTNSG